MVEGAQLGMVLVSAVMCEERWREIHPEAQSWATELEHRQHVQSNLICWRPKEAIPPQASKGEQFPSPSLTARCGVTGEICTDRSIRAEGRITINIRLQNPNT